LPVYIKKLSAKRFPKKGISINTTINMKKINQKSRVKTRSKGGDIVLPPPRVEFYLTRDFQSKLIQPKTPVPTASFYKLKYDRYVYMEVIMMPRSVTVIVRSICCSKIKGKVDEFSDTEEDKDTEKDDTE
jgi:hypothetical protein